MPSDPDSPEATLQALGERLASLRLANDLTQAELAERAGVARTAIVRLEGGGRVSLDSFVRVLQALDLAEALEAALPAPDVRPVDLVKLGDKSKQRAGRKRAEPAPWTWGDTSDEAAEEVEEE